MICKVVLNTQLVEVVMRDGARLCGSIVNGLPVGATLVDVNLAKTFGGRETLTLLFEIDDGSDEVRDFYPSYKPDKELHG